MNCAEIIIRQGDRPDTYTVEWIENGIRSVLATVHEMFIAPEHFPNGALQVAENIKAKFEEVNRTRKTWGMPK